MYLEFYKRSGQHVEYGYREKNAMGTFLRAALDSFENEGRFLTTAHQERQAVHAPKQSMITPAFMGSAMKRQQIGDEIFPAVKSKYKHSPCFFMAEKKDGYWWLSQYAGNSYPDNTFEGRVTTRLAGLGTIFVEQRLVGALASWMRERPVSEESSKPLIFKASQKVNPEARPHMSFEFQPQQRARWYRPYFS